jgi:hypothetical protein
MGVLGSFTKRIHFHLICLDFENYDLLGYYAVSSGNVLPIFWDNQSVPSSRVRNLRFTLCVPHVTLAPINAVTGFQTAFQNRATWLHHFGLVVATYSVHFEPPSLSVTCVSVLSASLG